MDSIGISGVSLPRGFRKYRDRISMFLTNFLRPRLVVPRDFPLRSRKSPPRPRDSLL